MKTRTVGNHGWYRSINKIYTGVQVLYWRVKIHALIQICVTSCVRHECSVSTPPTKLSFVIVILWSINLQLKNNNRFVLLISLNFPNQVKPFRRRNVHTHHTKGGISPKCQLNISRYNITITAYVTGPVYCMEFFNRWYPKALYSIFMNLLCIYKNGAIISDLSMNPVVFMTSDI